MQHTGILFIIKANLQLDVEKQNMVLFVYLGVVIITGYNN